MFDVLTFCPRKGYGCIYKYTLSNGKHYIGQTVQPLNYRHSQHMHNQYEKRKRYFDNALSCGKYTYTLTILELCEYDKLDFAEKEYIFQYNSLYPNGYNLESGGSASKYMSEHSRSKISEARLKWAEEHYDYLKDFRKLMNDPQYLRPLHRHSYLQPMEESHKVNIKKALNTPEYKDWKNKYLKELWRDPEYRARMRKVNNRKIRKYSLDGQFLEEYESLVEACEKSGIPVQNTTHLSRCARGKKKTAHGYIWRYSD